MIYTPKKKKKKNKTGKTNYSDPQYNTIQSATRKPLFYSVGSIMAH